MTSISVTTNSTQAACLTSFQPINAVVDVDEAMRDHGLASLFESEDQNPATPESETFLQGRNGSERVIKSLSESHAFQFHSYLSDYRPSAENQDQTIARLRQMGLPFVEDYRFRSLERAIVHERPKVLENLRKHLFELDQNKGKELRSRSRFVTKPTIFRTHERDGVLAPNLLRCIEAHFHESEIPIARRTFLDVGAWDGQLTSRLYHQFGNIIGLEPNDSRHASLEEMFQRLEMGVYDLPDGYESVSRSFSTINQPLQELIEEPSQLTSSLDVILMSHVLYFLRKQEMDYRALDWALDSLTLGGIGVVVLNDMVPEPGNRAHLRKHFKTNERNQSPQAFYNYLKGHGWPVDIYRPVLQFRSRTEDGLEATKDIMRYMLSGEEARSQESTLDQYVNRYVRDSLGDRRHAFNHVVSILVFRKTVNSQLDSIKRQRVVRDQADSHTGYVAASKATTDGLEILEKELFADVPMPVLPVPHADEIQNLMSEYKRNPSVPLRNLLSLFYKPVVKYQARRIFSRIPQTVALNELVGEGMFGLFNALDTFDLDREVKFETFCVSRVNGAMLDFLRKEDPLTRTLRSRVNMLRETRKALAKRFGRPPTSNEVRDELMSEQGLTEQQYLDHIDADQKSKHVHMDRKQYETDSEKEVTVGSQLVDHSAEDPTEAQNKRDWSSEFGAFLNAEELDIWLRYSHQDQTMLQIGNALGLSESRVSQMHGDIIIKIINRYKGDFDTTHIAVETIMEALKSQDHFSVSPEMFQAIAAGIDGDDQKFDFGVDDAGTLSSFLKSTDTDGLSEKSRKLAKSIASSEDGSVEGEKESSEERNSALREALDLLRQQEGDMTFDFGE